MKLTKASLDFARNHISSFYDSQFFIKPFEFKAIWANWDEVVAYLTGTEIGSLEVHSPMTLALPKPKGGFRIVHQLDPLNCLVYTALAYEVADIIESRRVRVDKSVACSYRIKTTPTGYFFHDDK